MPKILESALLEQKEQNEQSKLTILGTLGIPLGGQRLVEVPNRNSFVYVQLRDNQNEVIQAFNNKVAPSYGLPVVVQREGTRYIILGVDTQRYQNNWNNFSPYLPRHGNAHSRLEGSGGGGDVVWVASNQFMPLLTIPSGSSGGPNVIVSPHTLQSISGSWMFVGNTGTSSLLQYVPTGSNAVMVLVYLDRVSGNPYLVVNSGSYFANTITGTAEVTPYIPSVPNVNLHIPLGAIRLTTGTNVIGWDNIYDVRQYLQYISTGTGGGGLDTGTANGLYLRLDTSNDPLTGRLDISPTATGTSALVGTSVGNAITAAFNQYMSGNQNVANPLLYLYRSPVFGTGTFSDAFILAEQDRMSGLISGKLLSMISDGTERIHINPSAQGTGTNTLIDGDFVLSPGGMLLHLKNNGTSRFYVNASGTAYSNNVPLIKEAPVDGNSYVRKNAGWDVAGTNSIAIQDEGSAQGAATTLNFVGGGVDVSVSGTVARVHITGSSSIPPNGWIPELHTWTYHSGDDPSFVTTVNDNVTGTIGNGDRIWLTQHSQSRFFLVTKVSITGSTTYLNLYGGTDYDLSSSGTITTPYYSQIKAPFGFPLDPTKWSVVLSDSTSVSQATPTALTWYNVGSLSISIPIGIWRMRKSLRAEAMHAGTTNLGIRSTMSTANNSESDSTSTSNAAIGATGTTLFANFVNRAWTISVTTKTTYYLNLLTGTSGATAIAARGDLIPTRVVAESAYL